MLSSLILQAFWSQNVRLKLGCFSREKRRNCFFCFFKKIFRSLSVYYTHRAERPTLLRNAGAEHAALLRNACAEHAALLRNARAEHAALLRNARAERATLLRNTRVRLVLVFSLLIKGADLLAIGERKSPFQKSHLKKHFQSAFEHTFTKISYQH